ncbi:PREDICTED: stabilizer of axonemal microtubules 2-like [Polistes dominula]|uniref:Stabilizer of axonemal microtubules 2-like n=1 Tax=Polistes dominula TaxID=743375 RepID=A0ABM1ID35_POLDO|nr:PREDICTED: stabilizer of axonemal microtubules 2-like [Polistes dominula]
MEVVEVCTERKHCVASSKENLQLGHNKSMRRYVQPPRVKSFAPEQCYRPPSKPLDAYTTYDLSYINLDPRTAQSIRAQPYRPIQTLLKSDEKFASETTSKMSYQPIWRLATRKPIKPKFRSVLGRTGTFESATTTKCDYIPKYTEKLDMIIPCGSIRISGSPLDANTTSALSYVNPGVVQPVTSFKPITKYQRPSHSVSKDTTQKLSYQPFAVGKKEKFPWAQKATYKSPSVAMCGKTIYSDSYLENEVYKKMKPFIPCVTNILPIKAEFFDKTIYKESYLPCDIEKAKKIVPPSNIFISSEKISTDTTNKLSYQPVWCKKRSPIIPHSRKKIEGSMQSETTNRIDFTPKMGVPTKMIIPCTNIRIPKDPIVDKTTTGLSFIHPGQLERAKSFKPDTHYCRPIAKIDSETINKLSYQAWTPIPKMDIPWARRTTYQVPKDPMITDTIYQMSYPLPGYYIENECPCAE